MKTNLNIGKEYASTVIQLRAGGSIIFDGCAVRRLDEDENEIMMWDEQEFTDDAADVLGAMFGVALKTPQQIIDALGKTRVVDGVWV